MGVRSIKDVLARVRHDPLLEEDTVTIEVAHRGAPQDRRELRCERRSLRLAPGGFASAGEAFIPYHRVLAVRCGEWLWQRSGRGQLSRMSSGRRRSGPDAPQPMTALTGELEDWGIGMDSTVWGKLAEYRGLIERGNRVHNLVSRNLDREGLDRLILDSLAMLPLVGVRPGSLLDVGSGAGLPGLPLALALPELEAVLVEPSLKRAAFLEAAVDHLGLQRVSVRPLRIEELGPGRFHLVCVRGLPWAGRSEALARQLAPGGLVVTFAAAASQPAAPAGWRSLGSFRAQRVRVQAWGLI